MIAVVYIVEASDQDIQRLMRQLVDMHDHRSSKVCSVRLRVGLIIKSFPALLYTSALRLRA